MASPLIPLHAILGFIGALFYLWVAAELLRPVKAKEPALGRIHIAATLGLLALLISWVMGGYYYVDTYGPAVKPLVKKTSSLAHDVGMETKEHLFLFMPLLALMATALIRVHGRDLESVRPLLFWTALSIFLLGFIVAVEGFWVSQIARTALEVAR